MTAPATKDDLKATVADMEELFALHRRKLTFRFGVMVTVMVLAAYALHLAT